MDLEFLEWLGLNNILKIEKNYLKMDKLGINQEED